VEPDLPRLAADLVREWGLEVDGHADRRGPAHLLPVRTGTGEAAVLKVAPRRPELRHEHLALRAWDGHGSVRLLRADPHRSALLLERAEPGTDLASVGVVEACEVVAGLYARLHRPPVPPLDRLRVLAAGWADQLAELRSTSLAPRRFVDQAIGLAGDFAADPATDVALLHGDLHFARVLAAGREPWLAVDPEPLAGDPAYEVAPLLEHRWDEAVATRDLRGALLERLYTVVDVAGLDEDRVRDWVTVRELVAVLATSRESAPDRDAITRRTTIVKAVQR
jgi:streptomycin 6-kinase